MAIENLNDRERSIALAYYTFSGKSRAESERLWLQLAPNTTAEELQHSWDNVQLMRALSTYLELRQLPQADNVMRQLAPQGARSWEAHTVFLVGEDREKDWRTVKVIVGGGATAGDVMATVLGDIDAIMRHEQYLGKSVTQDSIGFAYVVPMP